MVDVLGSNGGQWRELGEPLGPGRRGDDLFHGGQDVDLSRGIIRISEAILSGRGWCPFTGQYRRSGPTIYTLEQPEPMTSTSGSSMVVRDTPAG